MRLLAFLLSAGALAVACSNSPAKSDAGTNATCASDVSVGWTNYALCAAGTGGNLGSACPAVTPPQTCVDSRPVAACCAWVTDPKTELARAPSSFHNFGAPPGQTAVDLSCVDTPTVAGTPQTVTLSGFLKVFVGGDADSVDVKVEVFKEGVDGALGALVGTAVTTSTSSPSRLNTWLEKCPADGCVERQFTYDGIPTETSLIVKTSDALGVQRWNDFYDYNIYFANSAVGTGDAGAATVYYDTTAVGTTDPATVTTIVGTSPVPSKGLLAGEVHDCGDVRLSGATVNTNVRAQTDLFYFVEPESNPLPNLQRLASEGTSNLGLFGAMNFDPGVPIHISAVGLVNGQRKLVGAYTVQVFAGAVTGLSLRGRRPYQHD